MYKLFSLRRKENPQKVRVKHFLDCISPSIVRFYDDYYLFGNQFRCVWVLREYPSTTEELALLRYLGEKENITLHVYIAPVSALEEQKIIANAMNQNRLSAGSSSRVQEIISAQSNVQDLTTMIANMHRTKEPLLHCSVFLELSASSLESLRNLQMDVLTELTRSKLNADKLILRQKEGFLSVNPIGNKHQFKDQFSRVLPASSVANLFPFNYSGHTDPYGFYIGKDMYGSNIIVDLDRRTSDKTNANVLILGNAGQGKSYLLKLLLINFWEAGNRVFVLDPEEEYFELGKNLGGDILDLSSGMYVINILEPKAWSLDQEDDPEAPNPFRQKTILAQHISFLRDFFLIYKPSLTFEQLDTLELLLRALYEQYGITNESDLNLFSAEDYPRLSDLYNFIQQTYEHYDGEALYTKECLRSLLLSLHSICKGSDSQYFDAYTNIKDGSFVVFGIKGILAASANLMNAMLFNVLSYCSNELLIKGNSVASLDEFYLFLNNKTIIEYIRNLMKRNRKKDSKMILASQNLEDFNIPEIRELTKPLFAIPTHQFLFNAGTIDRQFYMDLLQLEENEMDLIQYPQRGVCLYRCGNELYHLKVTAPKHKEILFGNAGGR